MSHDSLDRALTAPQVGMLGLTGALGTGLFLSTGGAIGQAGPAVIGAFLLTGLLTIIVIGATTEMTTQHPVAGGFGATSHAYLGPLGGFLARWNLAVVTAAAVGVDAVACATYLRHWWPQLSLGLATAGFSLAMVALNLVAVRIYGRIEFWMSMLKITVVAGFILLGIGLVCFGLPPATAPGATHLTDAGFAPHGLTGIGTAAVLAIFSFGGCETITTAAAECRDPRRAIPRASYLMVVSLVALYVLSLTVIVALLPWEQVAAGTGTVAESPFVTVLAQLGVPYAADALNGVLILAAFSAGLGMIFGTSRMLHSLAKDRLAPAVLRRTTETGNPLPAVMASAAGMAGASALAILSPENAFQVLVAVLTFGLALSWAIILITYLVFRARRARLGLPRPHAALPQGPVLVSLALVALLTMVASLAWLDGMESALTAGLPYLGVLVVAGIVTTRRVQHRAPNVLDDELAEVAADQPEAVNATRA